MKLLNSLFLGFVKLHILHHASQEPVYGLWLIEELEEHGYRLSPGTLYPILHSLEVGKLLKVESRVVDGKVRKYYSLTATGKSALAEGKAKAQELISEINE